MKVKLVREFSIDTTQHIDIIQQQVTEELRKLDKIFMIESYFVCAGGILRVYGFEKD